MTILPADTYTVVNKTIVTDYDKNLITLLYQPLIGSRAVSLYYTLLDELAKKEIMSKEETHHHLMKILQLKLENIVVAREKLEAVGLLKTYYKEGDISSYVYVIYSPISPKEFFSHPVLNVVLYNNVGKSEYNKIIDYFKIPKINLKGYKDITTDFSSCFTAVAGTVFEVDDNIIDRETNNLIIKSKIDFDMLKTSIPKSLLNENAFNEETELLINSLAYIYDIDNLNMQVFLRNSLNEKGLINQDELRKAARNHYQFENAGKLPTLIYTTQPEYLKKPKGELSNRAKLIYTFENITPYDYLKSKYKDAEPSAREMRLIEDLMIKYKLKAGVVNVLISFVLQINNQKFNRNYVEAIASQWNRLKIETVEEAMNLCEKEYKKTKRKPSKKKVEKVSDLPSWFEADLESAPLSDKEQKEIEKLFQDYK